MAATPRRISAIHTALLKFGGPPLALWLGGRVAFAWVTYNRTHEHAPAFSAAIVAISLLIFPLMAWTYARLKRVAKSDDALHVSNFRREVVVPLRDVDRVRQLPLSGNIVIVDLAHDTELGRRVVFVARDIYWGPFWRTHPMVDRLRDAVAAAKKKAEVG